MGNKYYFNGSGRPELFEVSEDGEYLVKIEDNLIKNKSNCNFPSCADKCLNHMPGEYICDVLQVETEELIRNNNRLMGENKVLHKHILKLQKRINKLEWIIAILVSILFSIGYLFLLKLCIWWLL